jgi:hypothetical protein
MDILPSALDSRIDPVSSHDDPAFSDLVARITHRLAALGLQADAERLHTTILEVVQDVAHFTLAWAEPEVTGSEPSAGPFSRSEHDAHQRW